MPASNRRNQKGIALIFAILAILVVTILALALAFSTDVETSINYNLRDSDVAFFGARAGREEARGRLSSLSTTNIPVPTLIPGAAGSIIYIRNPRSTEVVDPTDTTSPYFDNELCHENFPALNLTNPGANVPCTAGAPLASTVFFNSNSPYRATAQSLSFKWTRISLKINASNAPYYVNGSNAAATLNTQACYNGTNELVAPASFANCSAAGAQPVYVVTALAVTPTNGRKMLRWEIASTMIAPGAALNADGTNSSASMNNSSNGTGSWIPPTTIDGNAYDLNGNLLPAGSSCPAVPSIATDSTASTTGIETALDNLRQNIVNRANAFCNANGSSVNNGQPCTTALSWVRGSTATPRYNNVSNSCSTSTSGCYKNLNLSAPQLVGVGTNGSTTGTSPFGGATGNVAVDPTLTQITPAAMQQQIATINNMVTLAQQAGTLTTVSGSTINGGTTTYGSATNPVVVQVTANGSFRIQNNATVTGYGVLVVPADFEINASTFQWNGIVLVKPTSGELRIDSGASGFINGAIYLQGGTGSVTIRTSDSASNAFRISYSCAAIGLALRAVPPQVLAATQLNY